MSTAGRDLRRSVDGLHAKLDRYHAQAVAQAIRCEACRPTVEKHERILYGHNGNEGLIASDQRHRRFRRRVWAALSSIGAGALLVLWEWVKTWWRS
jgi:hypothetical protein